MNHRNKHCIVSACFYWYTTG